MKPRIGWFGSIDEMGKPDVLRRVREEMGLNTIIPESHLCHTSGFTVSPEVPAISPVEGWRAQPTLAAHRQMHKLSPEAFAVLPGVVSGWDDSAFLKVLDEAHRLEIDVWGHIGVWSYGGSVFPDLEMRDIDGKLISAGDTTWGVPFCPSKRRLNDWIAACIADIVKRYPMDGLHMDHARYAPPAAFHILFGCACADCEAEAGRMGYDFQAMKRGLLRLRQRLQTLDADRVHKALGVGIGFFDVLTALEHDYQILSWFKFRCDLLTARMRQFREAADGTGRKIDFGTDCFPPTFALLGGHCYADWEQVATFISGGFGGGVGWGGVGPQLFAAWARLLCGWSKGLPESDALALLYRLFGYDVLKLPRTVSGLEKNGFSVAEVVTHEVRKMGLQKTGKVGSYPPLVLNLTPEDLERVCDAVAESGHQGVIASGVNLGKREMLNIVRDKFQR
ncbi:MAG: hypothetical protein EXS64_10335 [Candidatus Latescibacteria bacterium]|nr:hypothetical protein [Candidatus Latescibacterota bacterium]